MQANLLAADPLSRPPPAIGYTSRHWPEQVDVEAGGDIKIYDRHGFQGKQQILANLGPYMPKYRSVVYADFRGSDESPASRGDNHRKDTDPSIPEDHPQIRWREQ